MQAQELQGWILIAGQMMALGYDAAAKLKAVMQMFKSDVSDADVDAVIRGTIADAERRLALARSMTGEGALGRVSDGPTHGA